MPLLLVTLGFIVGVLLLIGYNKTKTPEYLMLGLVVTAASVVGYIVNDISGSAHEAPHGDQHGHATEHVEHH